ncbi:MAG: zinc-ribbon domain-containing protein, partial [Promethearchaeota archaeon]
MTKFCTKCGGRIAEDSLFCEYCGSKVTTSTPTKPHFIKESQPPEKPVFSSYNRVSSAPSYTSSYRPSPRASSNWIKWAFIGVFIVVIVGF